MAVTQDKIQEELEILIKKAIQKLGVPKENDICRFIPSSTGGYIHHFTMRKMKHENPLALMDMIKKSIVNVSGVPQNVPPKQRAARGSRKKRDQPLFTKQDIDKMLQMARTANDKDIIRKLTPRKDLKTLKRELTSTIRRSEVDQDLWELYVDAAKASRDNAESTN